MNPDEIANVFEKLIDQKVNAALKVSMEYASGANIAMAHIVNVLAANGALNRDGFLTSLTSTIEKLPAEAPPSVAAFLRVFLRTFDGPGLDRPESWDQWRRNTFQLIPGDLPEPAETSHQEDK